MQNAELRHLISRIPHNTLAQALPHMRPFDHGREVREAFLSWAVCQRAENFASWEAAWNRWTRATAQRAGQVSLTVTCPDCRGRGFGIRTGTAKLCTRCIGRRRTHIRTAALYQKPPS